MAISPASGASAPLQTSWTRAEAACAARHRGDTYYALTHPAPKPDATAQSSSSTPDTSVPEPALAPGFTLHL